VTPSRPGRRGTRPAAARRPDRARTAPGFAPPPAGLLAALALAVLALLAPPLSERLWAVDGFRSVAPAVRLGLVAAAGLAALLAWRPPPRAVWWAVLAALAILVAFPLRESIHFLGDTGLRMRLLELESTGQTKALTFSELTWRVHGHPLDVVLGVWLPLTLARLGVPPRETISAVSLALLLIFAGGLARGLATRPTAPGLHAPLVAAVLLAGTIEAFAGYAESAGLLFAVAAWWWAALLAPLRRPRDGIVAAFAWLVFFSCHRVALAMLPVQVLRPVIAAGPDDQPGPRRAALIADALAAGMAAGFFLLSRGRLSGMDLSQFLASVSGPAGPRLVPLHDVLNLLVLVAPLALLVPAFVRREDWTAFVRAPQSRLIATAAVLLLPLLLVFPVAPNGLGAHRDWDLNGLLGISLTLGAGSLLARLPEQRLRSALVCVLPVLALLAGAWIAVNADAGASERRALALAADPRALLAEQRSQLLNHLGYQAADAGDSRSAARYFDRAFVALGAPGTGLRAAEAWVRAGEPDSARAAVARARAGGALPPNHAWAAEIIERWAAQLDSLRRLRPEAGKIQDPRR
jgi:hypothetical protein